MDADELSAISLRVWRYKQGEVVSFLIYLGDELGIYRAMAGAGPLTAAQLAARTGLHERWLLEWLRCQGAAGLLATPDGVVFELSEEAAEVLANEEGSTWFAGGAFCGGVSTPELAPRLVDAFRTGRGLSYEDLGPVAAHAVERLTAPWTKLELVPRIIPLLDGVVERLERGAVVADVGCGAGVAMAALAAAYPASCFEGWDPSGHALERVRERFADARLDNVELHCAGAAELPSAPTYDLVLTLDCLHDLPHPAEAFAAIGRSLKPDGAWLIKEIRAAKSWEENLRNPMLALMYGTSVTACLSSALSEPGGAGLGTLGLYPELAEHMCKEAGFTVFRVHDVGDPAHLYYEVRR